MAKWSRTHLPMQETQETWVQSLGGEDPLEGEMAAHPSILAWRIPSTWEPGGLRSVGPQRVRHDLATEHEKQQAFEMDFFHSAQLFYFSIHLFK